MRFPIFVLIMFCCLTIITPMAEENNNFKQLQNSNLLKNSEGISEIQEENNDCLMGDRPTILMSFISGTESQLGTTYSICILLDFENAPIHSRHFQEFVRGHESWEINHRSADMGNILALENIGIYAGPALWGFENLYNVTDYAHNWYGFCDGEPSLYAECDKSSHEGSYLGFSQWTVPDDLDNELQVQPCTISMDNYGLGTNSTGSQFLITSTEFNQIQEEGTSHMRRFGQIIHGCENITILSEIEDLICFGPHCVTEDPNYDQENNAEFKILAKNNEMFSGHNPEFGFIGELNVHTTDSNFTLEYWTKNYSQGQLISKWTWGGWHLENTIMTNNKNTTTYTHDIHLNYGVNVYCIMLFFTDYSEKFDYFQWVDMEPYNLLLDESASCISITRVGELHQAIIEIPNGEYARYCSPMFGDSGPCFEVNLYFENSSRYSLTVNGEFMFQDVLNLENGKTHHIFYEWEYGISQELCLFSYDYSDNELIDCIDILILVASDDSDKDKIENSIDECPDTLFRVKNINLENTSNEEYSWVSLSDYLIVYNTNNSPYYNNYYAESWNHQIEGRMWEVSESAYDPNFPGCNKWQIDYDGDGISRGNETEYECDLTIDCDEDGVLDYIDTCPASDVFFSNITNDWRTSNFQLVEFYPNGCASNEIDSDGDGVTDNLDNCNNSTIGASVGFDGCEVKVIFEEDSSENEGVPGFSITLSLTSLLIATILFSRENII